MANTTAMIMRCTVCRNPVCAAFEPDIYDLHVCMCGHAEVLHQAPAPQRRVLRPRGAFLDNACTQFRSIGGIPITDFHQVCICGGHYSAHSPLQSLNPTHTNLPNLPASVSVTEPPPSFQAPPTLSQIPHPQTAAAASQPHPPPMPLLSISPYQSQASRFPTPSQVPASAQVFGVPITHPASTSGRQRQPVQRGRGRAVQSIASRNMNRTKEIMIILLPRDIHPESTLQDSHAQFVGTYEYLPIGEQLAQDLVFMERQGLATTVTLRADRASENVLPQIQDAFNGMVEQARWKYPELAEPTFILDDAEEARDLRMSFQRLKFRVLKLGYSSAKGFRIQVDSKLSYRSFTLSQLSTRFSRLNARHPTRDSNEGLLIICPPDGTQLVGPIDENNSTHHDCYADFILAGLAKSGYILASGRGPMDDRINRWKLDYPHSCRVSCPQGLFHQNPEDAQSDSDAYENEAASYETLTATESFPRRSSRLATATARDMATASTVYGDASVFATEVDQSLESSQYTRSMPWDTLQVMPRQPRPMPIPIPPYVSSEPTHYRNLSDFENFMNGSRQHDILESGQLFLVEGDTLSDVAQGLVLVFQHQHVNHSTHHLMLPQETFASSFIIKPENATLLTMFSYAHWSFRAGRAGEDAIGGGVMRQVLLEAIHLASNGIVEDMDNGDGYLSLKISQDSIVDKATLDRCFALGALCAIFLVKTHSAPDPISPFLLQAVTGGLFSIVDLKWVQSVSPAAAAVLELLPTNADEPIPHHPSLESLVRSRFPGTTFSAIQEMHVTDQNKLRRLVFHRTLLGAREEVLENSLELKAFSSGVNIYLTPALPSFKEAIQSSSKVMLSGCYSRRITSPEQLIPHLRFKHWRSDMPLEVANTEELLPVVQKAVEQYLRGTGHPFHDSEICKNLADPLTFDEENTDPSLRSRRFVKALSGLEMMPVDNHKFTVSLYEDIKDSALFMGSGGPQYNRTTDLIPPTPHACLYELDIWMNQALIDALATADTPLGEDTKFDWLMHLACMKMGEDVFYGY